VNTCHPQLDWGSYSALIAIQLIDSLFQGNDTKRTFGTPSFFYFTNFTSNKLGQCLPVTNKRFFSMSYAIPFKTFSLSPL